MVDDNANIFETQSYNEQENKSKKEVRSVALN